MFLGATQEIILGFIYFNFEENSLLSLTSFGAFKYYPKKLFKSERQVKVPILTANEFFNDTLVCGDVQFQAHKVFSC